MKELILITVGVVIGAVLFGGSDKYYSQTAEEWFNDYDYLESCVDSFVSYPSKYVGYTLDELASELGKCL